MSRILAIDPGPERSAFLWLGADGLPYCEWLGSNDDALRFLPAVGTEAVVIEQVASYGMPVGAEVFETCVWTGRFMEACRAAPVHRLTRLAVKSHLCHSAKANDATIRQALIDRFGGKERAIGRKAAPGPLYGIKADLWAALAVAGTWADQNP